VASKVKGRTAREFSTTLNVWQVVEDWAARTDYMPAGSEEWARTYQRGTGFLVAPQMLRVSWTGHSWLLEAWVRVPWFSRIFTLMLMPEEIVVDRGGFVAVIPRDKARKDVNELLTALGQPTIG
jgi:hypothetical protein